LFQESKNSSGIIRSETYLTTNYEPDEPVGRETEIGRIADAVRPLTKRKAPENLLVYGPAGVGKTTCVKHVFDCLENQAGGTSVYINAWQYNSRSSLLTELLIQLGYPAPRKGKPVDELLSKLREWLDKNRGVAVAIDEFDQLQEKTEIIYDMQMLNQESRSSLGLVMVSNKPPSKVHLDPRSQSRLNCQTMQFNSYNAPQLEDILSKRVEQAFKPGTVSDEVVEEIAESVAESSGDCREALGKLLRAGRKACHEGLSEVPKELITT
jgi:cell division control protein 6